MRSELETKLAVKADKFTTPTGLEHSKRLATVAVLNCLCFHPLPLGSPAYRKVTVTIGHSLTSRTERYTIHGCRIVIGAF